MRAFLPVSAATGANIAAPDREAMPWFSHGLNANLGFVPEDRAENIRRVQRSSEAHGRRRQRSYHVIHFTVSR